MASGSQSSVGGTASNNISVDDGEAEAGVVNPKYPLWAHASKVSADASGRGGNTRFRCHFSDKTFPGSYSRVRAHLLQIKNKGVGECNKLPHDVFVQLLKDEEAARILIENGPTRRTNPLPTSDGSAPSRKRKTKQQGLVESFDMDTKQQADALIARMYYTGGMQCKNVVSCHMMSLLHCC